MKRLLVLVIVAAIATLAIWHGLRRGAAKTSSAAVTALLPKDTLLLAHVPDLNQTREHWRKTDLYQIWREPAVQDFLQKPRAKIPKTGEVGQRLKEIKALEMEDAFIAVTSWEASEIKIVGGFRFKGSAEDAENIVGKWRSRLLADIQNAKHETVDYQQHRLQVVTQNGNTLVTVYNRDWFLAATDIIVLQTLLDRLDGRSNDPSTTLARDDAFAAAFKHMPASYEGFVYGRMDRYIEKILPLLGKNEAASDQSPVLRRIRSFCGAVAFDAGKIRDVMYIEMPKIEAGGDLARSSLALGTRDTFLYAAAFLNFPKQLPWSGAPAGIPGLPAGLQKLADALSSSGITLEDWKSAFGPELGLIGDWPASSRLPALFATLPIKDSAKANQIVTALTGASGEDAAWTQKEKEGVRYFSMGSLGQFIAFTPTLALSQTLLVAGADTNSVEAAMGRSRRGGGELAASKNFRAAERAVPAAKQAFIYVDSALFYSRLDAALRPVLLMSAPFVPAISDNVDLNKLPAAEVITRHLSPIVLSQSYQGAGYLTESVGPITMNHAIIGLGAMVGGATAAYRQQSGQGGWGGSPAMPMASPTVSPSPTPEATP